MLLLKYEKFHIIKKDSFVEELIFKYEKNVNNYQTFEKKGRSLLNDMIALASQDTPLNDK